MPGPVELFCPLPAVSGSELAVLWRIDRPSFWRFSARFTASLGAPQTFIPPRVCRVETHFRPGFTEPGDDLAKVGIKVSTNEKGTKCFHGFRAPTKPPKGGKTVSNLETLHARRDAGPGARVRRASGWRVAGFLHHPPPIRVLLVAPEQVQVPIPGDQQQWRSVLAHVLELGHVVHNRLLGADAALIANREMSNRLAAECNDVGDAVGVEAVNRQPAFVQPDHARQIAAREWPPRKMRFVASP